MSKKGFTLIEILVAMVLLSMVTVVAVTALRLAIRAWERGEKEGEIHQAYTAVSSLLGKQLSCAKGIVNTRKLPFYGVENGISFFTTYAPQGSLIQGLSRVTYVYDEYKETLLLYEQVIVRKEDVKKEFNPLSDSWNNDFSPTGEVEGVSKFLIMYAGKESKMLGEDTKWSDKWVNSTGSIPKIISLSLQLQNINVIKNALKQNDENDEDNGYLWYFTTGVSGF